MLKLVKGCILLNTMYLVFKGMRAFCRAICNGLKELFGIKES